MTEEDDRPRRSWAEIDRMRDRPRTRRDERVPRGKAAQARARSATDQYLKKLDKTVFSAGASGGQSGNEHARRVLDALGTPDLDAACRAHLDAMGPPREPSLISAYLDARDRALRIAALRALETELEAGRVALTGGLLRQVRMLGEDLDDELAEAAEDVLAKMVS